MRGFKKRLRRLEDCFPPPPPPPLSGLRIEEWTREFMEGDAPQAGLYDEDFFTWYEGLGRRLVYNLGLRIGEAWGIDWYAEPLGLSEDECAEVLERAEKSMPPYIEKYWRQWQAGKPKRDRAIIAKAEITASVGIREDVFPNTDTPEMIRRRVDAYEAKPPQERLGRDWWISYHRERADLAEKYADWPEQWEQGFAQWQRESADG